MGKLIKIYIGRDKIISRTGTGEQVSGFTPLNGKWPTGTWFQYRLAQLRVIEGLKVVYPNEQWKVSADE